MALLELAGVTKTFRRSGGTQVHAVNNVSLAVEPGETVALVGESGSGKTTLGRIALGLVRPDTGRVFLQGEAILDMPDERFRAARTAMQPIFQDAGASLNPRRPVRELLAQATRRRDVPLENTAVELLEAVGLRPGAMYLPRFAHELSGGQRQRIAIARALAMEPQLLIADEPLSGADVSIRGQILNLLIDIRQARRVACLMITHDISIALAFADRVAVMMRGEIVETGPAQQVLSSPAHAYTRQLVASVPLLRAG